MITFSSLSNLLKPGRFARDVATVFTGNISGQILVLVATPAITRIYSPEEFGLMSLVASFIGVLSVFSCLRYEQAVVLPENHETAKDIMRLCSIISLGVFGLLMILTGLGDTRVATFLRSPDLEKLIWFVPFGVLLLGWQDILISWCTRVKAFSFIAWSQAITAFSSISIKLALGYLWEPSAVWLITGNIMGPFSAIFFIGYWLLGDFSPKISDISWRNLKLVAGHYQKFPKYGVMNGIVNVTSQNLPIFLLGYYFSPVIVGYYGLANSVLKKPVQFISMSMSRVFLQRIAQSEFDERNILQMLKKTTTALALLGVIPFLLLAVFGNYLFVFFFGPEWEAAGKYSQILAPWLFLAFINPPSTQVIIVKQDLRFKLWLEFFSLITRGLGIIIGYYLFKTSNACVILFAIISFIFNLVYIKRAFDLAKLS